MDAVLYGIKNVEYTKRDTGEHKEGIELHLLRKTYPQENFIPGSAVVFTEYLPLTANSRGQIDEIKKFPMGSIVNLVYVQNGRYSNLVEVTLSK